MASAGSAALQAIRGIHRQSADPVAAKMFLHFQDQRASLPARSHFDRLIKLRDLPLRKFDIHHATKDLHHTASCVCHDFMMHSEVIYPIASL